MLEYELRRKAGLLGTAGTDKRAQPPGRIPSGYTPTNPPPAGCKLYPQQQVHIFAIDNGCRIEGIAQNTILNTAGEVRMKERGGAGKSPNQEPTNQRNNHPNDGGPNKESAANTRLSPLLTERLKKQLPALYSQENQKDPTVTCKFFDPVGSWAWYAIEGSPVDEDGYFDTDKPKVDFLFFGFVVGFEPELGYFSLNELETAKQGVTGIKTLPIERDIAFTPCRLSDIKKAHGI